MLPDSQVSVIESAQEWSLYTNNFYSCGSLINSSSLCAMPNSKAIFCHLSVPCPQQGKNFVTLLNMVSATLAKKFGGKTAEYSKVSTLSLLMKVTATLSKWFGGKTNIGKTLSSSFTCRVQQRIDITDAKPTKVTVTLAKNFGGKTNHWITCQEPWHLV